jgi:ABC-type multidrug transport system fused ATPase/permease subunit
MELSLISNDVSSSHYDMSHTIYKISLIYIILITYIIILTSVFIYRDVFYENKIFKIKQELNKNRKRINKKNNEIAEIKIKLEEKNNEIAEIKIKLEELEEKNKMHKKIIDKNKMFQDFIFMFSSEFITFCYFDDKPISSELNDIVFNQIHKLYNIHYNHMTKCYILDKK